MERVILMVIALIIAIMLPVILIKIKFKSKYLMYIPVIVVFVLSIIFYILGKFFSQSMQDLGMYIMSLICLVSSIVSTIIVLLIARIKK